MNSAGNRIAIGSANSVATVLEWNGTSWNQVGPGFQVGSGFSGHSYNISIDGIGNRVVTNDPDYQACGSCDTVNLVKIYDFDGTDWVNSAEIYGEYDNGAFDYTSISLNENGNRIAIGNPGSDTSWGHNTDYGLVRVYEYRYIPYSEYLTLNSNNFYQNVGDPPIIVGTQNGWNTNPNNMYWVQMGSDIHGDTLQNWLGRSVSLNSTGDRLAVGIPYDYWNASDYYPGKVKVYEWNGTNWSQLGLTIDGESIGDRFGTSVSMNATGDRVAIGAPVNDGVNGNYSGHVRIYDWDGNSWTQQGQDIDGEDSGDWSGESLSMNATGDRVAIGAPHNAGVSGNSSGHVRIYSYSQNNGCAINSYITNNSPLLTAINLNNATYQWLDCENNYSTLLGEVNYEYNATQNGHYAVEITYGNGCVDTSLCVQVFNMGDTCSILDTLITQVYDTLITHDTLITQVYDTLTTYDTLITQVYDTLITYDTIYLGVTDTLYIDVNISGTPPITNTLKVYPNPTADQVIIDNGNYSTMGGYYLNILNSTGQQVFNSPINQAVFTIDISQFGANGLYFLQILNANFNVVEVKHIVLH